MNAAATQDVRDILFLPTLTKLLHTGAPTQRDARMVRLLGEWRRHGGSRLDRDLDGKIDDPGAAIMDAAWTGLADAEFTRALGPKLTDQLDTLFSRFDPPPGEQFSTWAGYMDKDLRTLLGMKVRGRYSRTYCGGGKLGACRKAMWAAFDAAGHELTKEQGTPDPSKWRADATKERIQFVPIPLREIRYVNRPSGIQQVITFDGHRR
jgi:hypothetical protein